MLKSVAVSFLVLLIASSSYAKDFFSSDVHQNKLDTSVKKCPKSEMVLAKEALELELLGRRYKKANPKCFEDSTAKYFHSLKNPDEAVDGIVSVVDGSEKILKIKFNKKFYSYNATFTVATGDGKIVKDSFSFMRSVKAGAAKSKRGCASLTVEPSKAFVKKSCL